VKLLLEKGANIVVANQNR
jgi:ankyrin repeat protein